MKRKLYLVVFTFLLTCVWSVCTEAASIDFNSLSNGEIVNNQFSASHGVKISAVNTGGGPDLSIIFDSQLTGTADPDLEGPSWGGGNLSTSTVLGNLLIIAENDVVNKDGLIVSPDDEGSRPAGSIFFDFDALIVSFGFDLIDVEGPEEFGVDSGFFATFFDETTTVLAKVGFGSLVLRDSAVYGNNTINRISPFTL